MWRRRGRRRTSLRVGDPELAAVDDVVAAFEFGAGLQGEGIGAGTSLAQGVGANSIGGHLRQVALLLFGITPAQERVVDQSILNVDNDAGRGIDPGQFFYRENRFEKFSSAAAVLLGDFDAHDAKLKKFVDERFFKDALFVHLLDQRADLVVGELTDVVAEKNFVVGERGQGRGRGGLESCFGHRDTFTDVNANW